MMKKENRGRFYSAEICITFLLTTFFYLLQLTFNAKAQQCSIAPLAKSADNFGASLTKAIGERNNLFVSFFSIYNALAMTYIGTKEETAKQMEEAFQFADNDLDKPKLNAAFQSYMKAIETGNDEYSLLLANGIFLQKNFVVNDQYMTDVQEFYHGIVQEEDYVNEGNKAINDINKFVSDNTRNKIEKIFEEPLEPSTILVLVNAIYFKGTWKIQFSEKDTKDGIFYKNDGSTSNVKLMKLEKQKFRYYEDYQSRYQFLELPYKGEDISMLFALPRDVRQVPNLDMTSDFLCKINSSLYTAEIQKIQIPKFKLRYRKELKDNLQKLGIKDLFSSSANLSGINKDGGLAVSEVLHEAVIDVNEEGSEAAAVTVVVIAKTTEAVDLYVITFIANHPFLFYIVDNRNGLLLFSGRVSDL